MTEPETADPATTDGPLVATPSQTVGPFFHFALTQDPTGGTVLEASGLDRIQLLVQVTDGDGLPVTDGVVEIWQAGEIVDATPSPSAEPSLSGFGRLGTGEDGSCEFDTVRPGRVSDGAGGRQAAHINVCLFARGLLRQLHTRIYFAGDPALDEDAVLALVPADRRSTLVASPDATRSGRWLFHVRLQGPDETVFFDV
jgi:protocatechuate 3,4-dioxygenase alpha subunit